MLRYNDRQLNFAIATSAKLTRADLICNPLHDELFYGRASRSGQRGTLLKKSIRKVYRRLHNQLVAEVGVEPTRRVNFARF